MSIGDWLSAAGLGHHRPAFVDNGIDVDVLDELSEEDLTELGLSLGDRRRFRKALAAMSARPPEPKPVAMREAERRQLTVMFCDLVGSTALSTRLDPEDYREVIAAYQGCCGPIVGRFGGHVAKLMGDGILVCFGYPQAHEDDAERAVLAGLAIVEAMPALAARIATPLPSSRDLPVRIGIATGEVVVGDLVGEGAAQEEAVLGETPNLAARLQALAPPGGIIVSAVTRRLIGGLFACRDLGRVALKGFSDPMPAWQVIGDARRESRFEGLRAAGMVPLVGREAEMAQLLARWERAGPGTGQVVLLSGEPGMGKSRLSRALRERLATEPHRWLAYGCSPYHTSSALQPFISQIERSAGIDRAGPPGAQLDRLEALLALAETDLGDTAPLVATLLSLRNDGRYPDAELPPKRRKELTHRALLRQLQGLAAREPVLLLFEDAHWADPSSVELVGSIIDAVQTLPVLVIVTFRPEFTAPWPDSPHVTRMTLSSLADDDARRMAEAVSGGRRLPGPVAAQILARSDGVPLFVEEMTRDLLESGVLAGGDHELRLAHPLPAQAVPMTLQDSLMARLDRLSPVKELAQAAAAIGRDFAQDLLAAVVGHDADAIRPGLLQLAEAGLIHTVGEPAGSRFAFKHALVQDAAYRSMVRGRRQTVHGRIAEALERLAPERTESEPELVALHYTEAGQPLRAVGYWLKAGQRAARSSANLEAVAHLRRGIAAVAGLPAGADTDRWDLSLHSALAPCLIATSGFTTPDLEQATAHALELAVRLGDDDRTFTALHSRYLNQIVQAKYRDALTTVAQLAAFAEERSDPTFRMMALRNRGMVLYQMGDLVQGGRLMEQACRLYDPQSHDALCLTFPHDPLVQMAVNGGLILWLTGHPDAALDSAMSGLSRAERLNHAPTLSYARFYVTVLHVLRRDFEAVYRMASDLESLATDYGMALWQVLSRLFIAWTEAEQTGSKEAAALVESRVDTVAAMGTRMFLPLYMLLSASAHRASGALEAAQRMIVRAELMARDLEEGVWLPEVLRVRGDVRGLCGAPLEVVEDDYRAALSLARSQGAVAFEARAAAGLAALSGRHGEPRCPA